MGKRNDALEALQETAARVTTTSANVVPLPLEQGPVIAKHEPPAEPRKVKTPVAKYMLYLPPKVKRKIEEIAFHDSRDGSGVKPHDHYLAALAKYLRDKGHPREAELLETALRGRGLGHLLLH